MSAGSGSGGRAWIEMGCSSRLPAGSPMTPAAPLTSARMLWPAQPGLQGSGHGQCSPLEPSVSPAWAASQHPSSWLSSTSAAFGGQHSEETIRKPLTPSEPTIATTSNAHTRTSARRRLLDRWPRRTARTLEQPKPASQRSRAQQLVDPVHRDASPPPNRVNRAARHAAFRQTELPIRGLKSLLSSGRWWSGAYGETNESVAALVSTWIGARDRSSNCSWLRGNEPR
jgi:hypothetical protein